MFEFYIKQYKTKHPFQNFIQIINSYKVPGAHKRTRDVSSDKDLSPSAWPVIATSVFMGFCMGLYEPTDYLGIIYVASLIWITFIHTNSYCRKC